MIKQNKYIKGIVINDKYHKISQYADDTSLTLDGSSESLFAALKTIEFVSSFSGLKINSCVDRLKKFFRSSLSSYQMDAGLGLNNVQFIRHQFFC